MPTKGSVLVLQFGPVPRSYVATSYPHRILDADPDDYRVIHCENMPRSLSQFLREFKRDEKRAGEPRYLMNLATFAPLGSPDWNGATAEDPPGNLWYVYYWITRADHQWNATLPPGRLSLLASEFRSGSLSHVAFGPTQSPEPECMFLRNTAADERWHYQWTGLPFLCERDCLKHVEGGAPLKDLYGEAHRFNGVSEWKGGRLRGVTFGRDDSYIVYRGENYDWDGAFPLSLAEALRKGKDEVWSINNCFLNPRNPNEYVLAFNEADDLLRVYYALHQDFAPKFENVIEEWAKGKGFSNRYQTFPTALTDAQCQHDHPALNVPRSSSRARSLLHDGYAPSPSAYPPTTVLPQRANHRPATSLDSAMENGSPPPRISTPAEPQPYVPAIYETVSPGPSNSSHDRVDGPSELLGSISHRPNPPYRPQVVHPDRDYPAHPVQPIQHIQNYYAGAPPSAPAKKSGWGKRLSKAWGGDNSRSNGQNG